MRIITDGVEGYTDRELRAMSCEQLYMESHRLMFIVNKTLSRKAEGYKVTNYNNRMTEIWAELDCENGCEFCDSLDSGVVYLCEDERCDSCKLQRMRAAG